MHGVAIAIYIFITDMHTRLADLKFYSTEYQYHKDNLVGIMHVVWVKFSEPDLLLCNHWYHYVTGMHGIAIVASMAIIYTETVLAVLKY